MERYAIRYYRILTNKGISDPPLFYEIVSINTSKKHIISWEDLFPTAHGSFTWIRGPLYALSLEVCYIRIFLVENTSWQN